MQLLVSMREDSVLMEKKIFDDGKGEMLLEKLQE